MASSDDPFDIFGRDSSESTSQAAAEQASRRDPSNGILVHHDGTETSLYHFVANEMEGFPNDDTAKRQRRILALVDQFCYTRHWMMHVGPDKGTILE